MSIIARFRAIGENQKAAVVRKLIEASTPEFDFFYLVALSMSMATLGLLLDNPSVVIGSMLIAPLLYPILSAALGFVMSNPVVIGRSFATIGKSLMIGLGCSVLITLLFSNADTIQNHEILSRTEPSLLFFFVALVAGAAVSFSLAQPEWSETLPGIAISVALIPPLSVVGIGVAHLSLSIISGSLTLVLINILGIMLAAFISFSLMDLYTKQDIAESTIRKEEKRIEEENRVIAEVNNEINGHKTTSTEAAESPKTKI